MTAVVVIAAAVHCTPVGSSWKYTKGIYQYILKKQPQPISSYTVEVYVLWSLIRTHKISGQYLHWLPTAFNCNFIFQLNCFFDFFMLKNMPIILIKIDKFLFFPGKQRYRVFCQCIFEWDGDKTNGAVGLQSQKWKKNAVDNALGH